MLRRMFLTLICLPFLCQPAWAHFIWAEVKPVDGGKGEARFYFGETAAPGEPHLIGKIAHTKAWVRAGKGEVSELKLASSADKELAALVAPYAGQAATSIEAKCDYGIYQRGPIGLLVQYYARHLAGDWPAATALARADKLALDVAPKLSGKELSLQVFYNGKPSADSEVVITGPEDESQTLRTDAEGVVKVEAATPGRYAIRAAYIEPNKSGERDGKKYSQTWHYTTLTLDVPAASAAASGAASAAAAANDKPNDAKADETPAAEVLARARAARSVWKDFPGFTADVTLYGNGSEVSGKISIDDGGTVSLDLPESTLTTWAEQQLTSLVQHRMPDGEVQQSKVTYADNDVAHPLGRKIDLGDPSLQSAYRIKDDVILEVNRLMGKSRFTISVMEVVYDADHKYLPRSFTMNFFDAASGQLRTSLAYWNDWHRVGNFDLPKTILEIGTQDGAAGVKRIVFKNLKLTEK